MQMFVKVEKKAYKMHKIINRVKLEGRCRCIRCIMMNAIILQFYVDTCHIDRLIIFVSTLDDDEDGDDDDDVGSNMTGDLERTIINE